MRYPCSGEGPPSKRLLNVAQGCRGGHARAFCLGDPADAVSRRSAARLLQDCAGAAAARSLSASTAEDLAACYVRGSGIVFGADCSGLEDVSQLTPDGACCTSLEGLGMDCISAMAADPNPPMGLTPGDMCVRWLAPLKPPCRQSRWAHQLLPCVHLQQGRHGCLRRGARRYP